MELEIKSKKIDYHYSEFRMLLIAYICVYFMSPIFIFFIKSDKKYYYILLINAVFVMIFYMFIVILQIFFKLLKKLMKILDDCFKINFKSLRIFLKNI